MLSIEEINKIKNARIYSLVRSKTLICLSSIISNEEEDIERPGRMWWIYDMRGKMEEYNFRTYFLISRPRRRSNLMKNTNCEYMYRVRLRFDNHGYLNPKNYKTEHIGEKIIYSPINNNPMPIGEIKILGIMKILKKYHVDYEICFDLTDELLCFKQQKYINKLRKDRRSLFSLLPREIINLIRKEIISCY